MTGHDWPVLIPQPDRRKHSTVPHHPLTVAYARYVAARRHLERAREQLHDALRDAMNDRHGNASEGEER